MIKTAVIIAGGSSQRLRPLTDNKPKTLVEVKGKPILYWIIQWLKKHQIEHVVLGVAYKKEMIYDYMNANRNFGLKVDFSEHTVEGGTAQGFKLAIKRFVDDEDFLAMNGDELTNLDIGKLYEAHKKNNAIVTLASAPFHCRFSVLKIGDEGKIVGFERDMRLHNAPVHIGVNMFNKRILNHIPDTGGIEELVFKKLADENNGAYAYMLPEHESWMSINTQKDLEEATTHTTNWLTIS
ncbi:MAG: nucleotidyltransferase family protein [Candidatus Micrarchaeota archaeon]|nr:nucleotidyltransferase family protein [Candidatus Micrarchaeota archaeon]